MSSPKFPLYATVRCLSERAELQSLHAQLAFVIAHHEQSSGQWHYTIAASKFSPLFECREDELEIAEKPPLISDEEILADVIAQTAELRHSAPYEDVRALLRQRGIDPMKCLQTALDQGGLVSEVAITLVLPDGKTVFAELEGIGPGEATQFDRWDVSKAPGQDRESVLCREIVLAADTSAFDARVYDAFLRGSNT